MVLAINTIVRQNRIIFSKIMIGQYQAVLSFKEFHYAVIFVVDPYRVRAFDIELHRISAEIQQNIFIEPGLLIPSLDPERQVGNPVGQVFLVKKCSVELENTRVSFE